MLIDEFVDRTSQPYIDFWVALGQNRCRLRRQLTHVITAWDLLQADSGLVDSDMLETAEEAGVSDEVMPMSCWTWVYCKKLWMIEKIILLGFEQDIYLPDEFSNMYLFLSLVSSKRKTLLRRIEEHYDQRSEQLRQGKKLRQFQEVQNARPYLESQIEEASAISCLSLALGATYTLLLYLRLIPIPKRPFSKEELRYELRMKPFLGLEPAEVPYFTDHVAHTKPYGDYASPRKEFYAHTRDPSSSVWQDIDDQLQSAKVYFTEVKKLGAHAAKASGVQEAWAKDVQNSLATCVALGVTVAGLKALVTKADLASGEALDIKIEIPDSGVGKRYAEGWIVPKIVKA